MAVKFEAEVYFHYCPTCLKMTLDSKVDKTGSKIIISFHESKSATHSVVCTYLSRREAMRMITISALNASRHVIENSLDGRTMRQTTLKQMKVKTYPINLRCFFCNFTMVSFFLDTFFSLFFTEKSLV